MGEIVDTYDPKVFLEAAKKQQEQLKQQDQEEQEEGDDKVYHQEQLSDLKEEIRLTNLLKEQEEKLNALGLRIEGSVIVNKAGNQRFPLDKHTEKIIVDKNSFTITDYGYTDENGDYTGDITILDRRLINGVPIFKQPNED